MLYRAMDQAQLAADGLYKQHFGKMVALIHHTYRDLGFETSEDIVHDCFSAALADWKINGVPQNAIGWIYKVCKNKALNKLKRSKHEEVLSDYHYIQSADTIFQESLVEDFQLRLLFSCAHPDLSPKVQLVITLKYVCNLKIKSIANVLGMTVDGVDKLLLRARQKIQTEKILFEEPSPPDFASRLPRVLKVLYLLFNEGYKSSYGQEIVREELCEEALLMTRSLLDHPLATKDVYALNALMLFNIARFTARFGDNGEILDLEKQNRSRWDNELITLACDYLHKSLTEALSTYHYEASIACLHCTADSVDTTNWSMISKLYSQLLQTQPNPFIELNYAIACYYAGEKKYAFKILDRLRQHPFMKRYYLLNATLGKLHLLEGNNSRAHEFLVDAMGQVNLTKERDFIRKMVDKTEVRQKKQPQR
jgi:RNA polymerase sigma factor (sigma-70 family)